MTNSTTKPPTAAWHGLQTAYGQQLSKRPVWRWPAWIAGALVAAVVLLLFIYWPKRVPSTETLILGSTTTQEEGFRSALPPGLFARAQSLAATGGGTVVGVVGAGSTGQQVSDSVALRVETDGQLENDPQARETVVQQRLRGLLAAMKSSTPPGSGRSLTGLLAGVAAALGHGRNEIWLETLGLPTTPGEDTRILTAADPAAAAAAIPASSLTPLTNATVHIVLLPAAGDQPALTATTDLWRKAFVADVIRRTGAQVADVTEDTVPSSPADAAPTAPIVPNIAVATKAPKTTTPPKPGKPLSISLDTSTAFKPDTAQWAVSTSQVKADLKSVRTAWETAKGHLIVTVTGHCARFGPAAGAVALSKQRAVQVATQLRSMGVTVNANNVIGNGYNSPLPDPANPQSVNNRTVVVTARSR